MCNKLTSAKIKQAEWKDKVNKWELMEKGGCFQTEVKKLRWGVGLNWSGSEQDPVEETCIDDNEILD